jgi:PmbA protein
MKQELYDLTDRVVKTTKAAGAKDCRVTTQAERRVEIAYRDRRPETIKEASTRTVNVEIFVDGRYSSQTTSDLRPEALKPFLENAVAATKLLAEDPFRTLPDPKYYRGRSAADLKLADPAIGSVIPAQLHDFAKALEASCLEHGGDKVISAEARSILSSAESVLMASNGLDGYAGSTGCYGGVSLSLKDEGDRRPSEFAGAAAIAFKDLPKPEAIGAEAARRTLERLGARKVKTETLPVIVENRVVGQLGGGLLQALFGRAVQQKQSFLADKKGQPVASPLLTFIDDPLLVGGFGSSPFDQEGLAARKRVMIGAGVLRDFFVDWYYSRKLGWEPTTGGPSNMIIPPGKRPVAEIMKDLGRGIFITGFIGGNSNSTTGDMSIGITGQLFDKGLPVQAVEEMNIADNHLKLWPKLIEVGNDPYPYSPRYFPSLVFKDIIVSGV